MKEQQRKRVNMGHGLRFGAPCLFFDVIVLLLEKWMCFGMSTDGLIRSYYMNPKGKEGTPSPTG